MAFDSLDIFAACALFFACVSAWLLSAPLRASARLYLRFGAMLLASLGVARLAGLADVAALFLLPLGAASLMISALARFARPLPVFAISLVLIAALACGLAALVSGIAVLALVPTLCFAAAIIAASLNGVAAIPVLAGAALLASGLALLEQGARAGVFLFCAAAVVGLSKPNRVRRSALAVEQ
jgi:hypothetical protein